jgi:NhaP-type Na+/H+ and K+/H+ antiporter
MFLTMGLLVLPSELSRMAVSGIALSRIESGDALLVLAEREALVRIRAIVNDASLG